MFKLHSYKGGRAWGRIESPSGGHRVIVSEEPTEVGSYENIEHEIDGVKVYEYRTKGPPLTAHHGFADFGGAIERARKHFGVEPAVIFGTICIEATKWRDDRSHFDPRCIRFEPGYESDRATPNKVSPGLMQTLISTAQGMNDRYNVFVDLVGAPEKLTRQDLFIAERSILLGTCYLRHHFDRVEDDEAGFDADDPVLAWSAFNAGSVRETSSNPWRLVTYGKTRVDKAIAYHNDAIAVLEGRC